MSPDPAIDSHSTDISAVLTPGARIADGIVLGLLAIALWIVAAGGARLFGFHVAVSRQAPLVCLYTAGSILLVRHLLWPKPHAYDRVRNAHAWLLERPDLAAAVRAFVATRPVVLLVGFLAVVTIGMAPRAGFTLSSEPLANLPSRFDAGWYGQIALDGYVWNHTFDRQGTIAFFPAMPLLMRTGGAVFGTNEEGTPRERRVLRALWAGVVISLAAFLWGLYYFIRLGRDVIGPERAADAALLLAAYPFALFFSAPYTESLFLLGAVAAVYHFRRQEWIAASCWGLVVGLTRPNGCFVSVPLAIFALQQIRASHRRGEHGQQVRRRAVVSFVVAAMPGIGMLLFTGYLYGLTGVWFAWAKSHQAWGRTFQGFGPIASSFGSLLDQSIVDLLVARPFDALNTAGFLFGSVLTYPVFKRLGAAWGVFVLINLLPPLFAGGVLSMGRLSSTLFPLFMALALLIPSRSVPAWAAGFAVVQGLCAALFFTWRALY